MSLFTEQDPIQDVVASASEGDSPDVWHPLIGSESETCSNMGCVVRLFGTRRLEFGSSHGLQRLRPIEGSRSLISVCSNGIVGVALLDLADKLDRMAS